MKREKISEAMGNISSRHIKEAAEFKAEEKPHRNENAWMKWGAIAACFALVCVVSFVGGKMISSGDVINSSLTYDKAVIDYGQYIVIPVLVANIIALWLTFTKHSTKIILHANIISFVSINVLNVFVVFMCSQFGGMNILGNLPIILISSNVAAIISIVSIILLGRKIKTWWLKLLLWLTVSIIAIILACIVHNIVIGVLQGDMVTIA